MDQRKPAAADGARHCLRGRRYLIALVLTTVGGFVDAFGYLALYRVFVANMSGNSIAVGLRLARHDWVPVFHRGLPVAAFVGGLVSCALVIEIARRSGVRRVLGLSLILEAGCLAAFLVMGIHILGRHSHPSAQPGAPAALLVAIAAFAMGTQNVSLRDAGVLNIYTTHVTGTLTRMAQRFVQFIVTLRSPRAPHLSMFYRSARLACLWLAYVGGAAAGAWSWMDVGIVALWGPIAATGAIAALAFICSEPLS